MPILTRLREFLEMNKVPYSVHSHPQAYTAQEVAALAHIAGRMLAKVVMVKAGDRLIILVMPADHRVDLERLKGTLANDVRLATEAEFRDAFPGCEAGAMPPFGNLFGIPVYVDRSLEPDEEIVFNAGTHTLTAKLGFGDFVRLTEPRMAEFAAPRASLNVLLSASFKPRPRPPSRTRPRHRSRPVPSRSPREGD